MKPNETESIERLCRLMDTEYHGTGILPKEYDLNTLGIDNGFPESLYVLKHVPTGKYGCYGHDGVHGLACFSDEAGANEFGTYIELPGMIVIRTTFDGARDIAKGRPLPVTAMFLLDDIDNPRTHYVK